MQYEEQLGIPRVVAYIQDAIFERLEFSEAVNFAEQFLVAINPGADLTGVWTKFALWVLKDFSRLEALCESIEARAAVERVCQLFEEDCSDPYRWREVVTQAEQATKTCSSKGKAVDYAQALAAHNFAFAQMLHSQLPTSPVGRISLLSLAGQKVHVGIVAAGDAIDDRDIRWSTYGWFARKLVKLLHEAK